MLSHHPNFGFPFSISPLFLLPIHAVLSLSQITVRQELDRLLTAELKQQEQWRQQRPRQHQQLQRGMTRHGKQAALDSHVDRRQPPRPCHIRQPMSFSRKQQRSLGHESMNADHPLFSLLPSPRFFDAHCLLRTSAMLCRAPVRQSP